MRRVSSKEVAQKFFSQPLDQARHTYALNRTAIRRFYADVGLVEWPYRRLKHLLHNITRLETLLKPYAQSNSVRADGLRTKLRATRQQLDIHLTKAQKLYRMIYPTHAPPVTPPGPAAAAQQDARKPIVSIHATVRNSTTTAVYGNPGAVLQRTRTVRLEPGRIIRLGGPPLPQPKPAMPPFPSIPPLPQPKPAMPPIPPLPLIPSMHRRQARAWCTSWYRFHHPHPCPRPTPSWICPRPTSDVVLPPLHDIGPNAWMRDLVHDDFNECLYCIGGCSCCSCEV